MTNPQWFEADKKGLAQLVDERHSKASIFAELWQNAVDEDVTDVSVSFAKRASDNRWVVTVTDDAPEGFADLRDAFTLFKPSKKKGDATKRGRFNLGEKLVLALASEATITSTKGTIQFSAEGRKQTRHKRPSGTCFQGVFPTLTNKDVEDAFVLFSRLIPPAGVRTFVHGAMHDGFVIEKRVPVVVFDATLPTEMEDGDGKLRRTNRKCSVEIYEADGTFVPAIYELGIPVVETDDKFVVNITQKVPLNMERDNVTPAYLRQLRTLVLNETASLLSAEEATSTWVAEALSDERVDSEVVGTIIKERFGNKVVAFDPSDPEANRIAAANGYTVIGGRTFSKDQWANLRKAGVIEAAGKITPSPKVMMSTDGIPPLAHDKWTADHKRIADYARSVHRHVVLSGGVDPVECKVDFQHQRTANRFSAWYGRGHLTLNIAVLGKAWLKNVGQEELDRLLIHEFGHYYESNHLSDAYYDALCEIGARLRKNDEKIGDLK